MPKLSIVSHFYNHPEMVERQIAHWKKIPAHLLAHIEFILVDDCSEQVAKIDKGGLNLRLFRVISDIPWNQAGSRNLGAFNASGEWALFFDIDQQINIETVEMLLGNLAILDQQTMFYMRIKELINILNNQNLANHPNTFLVHMKEFKTMGMYDEDFAGYYGYEDLYIPRVWETAGGKLGFLSSPVFFEDMGFGTKNFDRDLERNKSLMIQKMTSGCKNAPGILRFVWEEVKLA